MKIKILLVLLLAPMVVTYGYDVKRVGCGHYKVTPVMVP